MGDRGIHTHTHTDSPSVIIEMMEIVILLVSSIAAHWWIIIMFFRNKQQKDRTVEIPAEKNDSLDLSKWNSRLVRYGKVMLVSQGYYKYVDYVLIDVCLHIMIYWLQEID